MHQTRAPNPIYLLPYGRASFESPFPGMLRTVIAERSPAGVGHLEASNLDCQALRFHDLNPYRCEPTTNKIGHCLQSEPAGERSIHVAATRRLGQHFEHSAMCRAEALVFELRGHFAPPPRRGRPNRSLSGQPRGGTMAMNQILPRVAGRTRRLH